MKASLVSIKRQCLLTLFVLGTLLLSPSLLRGEESTAWPSATRYSPDGNPECKEILKPNAKGIPQRYRAEHFVWGKGNCSSAPLLVMRWLEGTGGEVIRCLVYRYDEADRLIEETLYGDLSGSGTAALKVDEEGKLRPPEGEHYSTYYTYADQEPHLLIKKTEDNGHCLLFAYDPITHQKTATFWVDGDVIRLRHFYLYDEAGVLVEKIVDDGRSEEAEDFDGVSERHSYRLIKEGNETAIEHRAWDLATHQELQVSKEVLSYGEAGRLLQTASYGSDNGYYYGTLFQYDERGQPVVSLDTQGKACGLEFDGQGKLLHRRDKENKACHWTYDADCRPIQGEELSQEESSIWSQTYDAQGRKSATADRFGNETRYRYDGLGRLTEISSPEVLDVDDKPYRPTASREYDVCDLVVAFTNQRGDTTRIRYNARGQPADISYPDGSTESFRYALDGSRLSFVDRQGHQTSILHDFFGRETERTTTHHSEGVIHHISFAYNAFHLLEEIDSRERKSSYAYDAAGRLKEKRQEKEGGVVTSRYEYDARGWLQRIVETRDDDPDHPTIQVIDRASSGEVSGLHTQTSEGVWTSAAPYSKASPCQVKDSARVSAEDEVTNGLGQRVRRQVLTESGGTTTTTFDALGRAETMERTEQGHVVCRSDWRYDGLGHKLKETLFFATDRGDARTVVTRWSYDSEGRLEAVTLAEGSSVAATCRFRYGQGGRLEAVVKPDGVLLSYTYDDLGRLSDLSSSDGTVRYHYDYDARGDLVRVTDGVTSQETIRVYTRDGDVAEERLANGLLLKRSFDLANRCTSLRLPDGTAVNYLYEGSVLKEIKRLNSALKERYSHRYTHYDAKGRLIRSDLIYGQGTLSLGWTKDNAMTHMTTPWWATTLPEECRDSRGNLLETMTSDVKGSFNHSYSYDDQRQLIREVGPQEHEYAYDALWNITRRDGVERVINERNQVIQAGEDRYFYDLNGNLLEKRQGGTVVHYRYDALDRLVEVIQDGKFSLVYTYDSFHRRLKEQRSDWVNGSWQEQSPRLFLYDGEKEIGAATEEGKLEQLRLLGLGLGAEIGAAVAVELNTPSHQGVFIPVHDSRGCVTCLVDAEKGSIVESYRYGAFGERQIFNEKKELLERSLCGNPWQYSSKRYDEDTGLLFFGRRYYDPSLQRWISQDPLGDIDGPNRYAYVHNNPVNEIDGYGCFSLSAAWSYLTETAGAIMTRLLSASSHSTEFLVQELSRLGLTVQEIEKALKEIIGPTVLDISGYHEENPLCGTLGQGEVHPKVRISCLNGIMTCLPDFLWEMQSFSQSHGNSNIHYIYHPNRGWTLDAVQGLLLKITGISCLSHLLSETWKALIEEMGGVNGGGLVIHYAHSIGGSDTYEALKLMTPEERGMIRVITFGSTCMISKGDLADAMNYVSASDGVPLAADPLGCFRGSTSDTPYVTFLGSFFNGIPFTDHLICNETYRTVWEQLGKEFVATYGSLPSE